MKIEFISQRKNHSIVLLLQYGRREHTPLEDERMLNWSSRFGCQKNLHFFTITLAKWVPYTLDFSTSDDSFSNRLSFLFFLSQRET